MENRSTSSGAPPRMMNAIIAGFNVVANNLVLLVLPVLIDLFLWLGPQVSIRETLKPSIDDVVRLLKQINSPQVASQMNVISEVWEQILVEFNLLGTIRTMPIGVPSLMSSALTQSTPLGSATIYEVPSIPFAFGIWLVVILVGFIVGCVYFCMLARATAEDGGIFEFKFFLKKVLYALALTLSLVVGLLVITIPALMLISVIALISPGLGDFAVMFVGFLLIWMLLPLVFTPHAIFSGKSGLVVSAMTSVRLVRSFMPGTGIFLIVALVFSQGLNVLWRVPPTNSWMTLIGILGHAFILTAIFAASFVYFRNGLRWMLASSQPVRPQELKT
ncbi:MAG TPA: hypothetical protein VN364_05235 [Bellilinea sp.]|nr:hypothetical protein [Bellilinea sp.]